MTRNSSVGIELDRILVSLEKGFLQTNKVTWPRNHTDKAILIVCFRRFWINFEVDRWISTNFRLKSRLNS